MANYEYLGCVTGFSEARTTQLIQPIETPMPVTRASNAYTERLLGVGLLVGNDSGIGEGFNPIVCTPTNISFQTPENSDLIESGDSGLVHARYRVNGGEWVDFTQEFGSMIDWYSAVDELFIRMEDYIDSFGQTKPLPFTRRFGEYGLDHLGLAGAPSSGSISELNGHSLLSYDMSTGEETGIEVLEEVTTTIEFVVSDGEGADLVQELFGGDYTAISCGTVVWPAGM